jgi:hypothetical protein
VNPDESDAVGSVPEPPVPLPVRSSAPRPIRQDEMGVVPLRLPKPILDAAAKRAADLHISRNEWFSRIIKFGLAQKPGSVEMTVNITERRVV